MKLTSSLFFCPFSPPWWFSVRLIPVLMKTRKNITNYPEKRDANYPVEPRAVAV